MRFIIPSLLGLSAIKYWFLPNKKINLSTKLEFKHTRSVNGITQTKTYKLGESDPHQTDDSDKKIDYESWNLYILMEIFISASRHYYKIIKTLR